MWQWFIVDEYKVYIVGANIVGYPDIHAYIVLTCPGAEVTLWFYKEGASIPANSATQVGSTLKCYARYRQAHFDDCLDLLRNEEPVNFGWNGSTLGVVLSTGQEPVGEAEV
jgi:hypothetical protein